MTKEAATKPFRKDGALARSKGMVSGLGVVDVFSSDNTNGGATKESYEESYEEYRDGDTASLTHTSWDGGSADGAEDDDVSTISSDSPDQGGRKAWKGKVNPWKELKKKKHELREKSADLVRERRQHQSLEASYAEMKLEVAKAKEEKDEYLAWVQKANDERDLAKVTAENEIYQLLERLKESETKRLKLEEKVEELEQCQPNRGRRRSFKGGEAILRSTRRFILARRNQPEGPAVPLDCIKEQ